MPIILETSEFVIKAHDQPHHSRENGGHIVITPKQRFHHRHQMPLDLSDELNHLTMITGQAMTTVLSAEGLKTVRINYHDMGNWAYKKPVQEPQMHVQLYMRTIGEKHPDNDPRFQAFPDALVFPDRATGYYDKFVPLSEKTCEKIALEIHRLTTTEKYESVSLD